MQSILLNPVKNYPNFGSKNIIKNRKMCTISEKPCFWKVDKSQNGFLNPIVSKPSLNGIE